jgi:flagellar hook-associated protein 1 FlgK
MLGLFGTLSLGAQALQTQNQGIEVAGQNIANANNPAYARQRLNVQSTSQYSGALGMQGTGITSVGIQQLRDSLLDSQISGEQSVTGSLNSQQTALQNAEAALGTQLNQLTSGSVGSSATGSVGDTHSISAGLSDLFGSFQALSNDPTSVSARGDVIAKATAVAGQFNQVQSQLNNVNQQLNQSVSDDTQSANNLLSDIAGLNDKIISAEAANPGSANDLRDLRQQKIEAVSQLVKVDSTQDANGAVDLSVGGVAMVTGGKLSDTLQTFDSGGGKLLVRDANGGATLTINGGSIHGMIDARDGAIAKLQTNVNSLAASLITEVNKVHATGYNLSGATGNNFFSGTGAGDIQVNAAIAANPSLIQASGDPAAVGNNATALKLGQLGAVQVASLGNQTFGGQFSGTVADLGNALSTVNAQIGDQGVVSQMLQTQRDSVSGVSLDEEMTNLTKYQKAYQASARLINTVDQMLDTMLSLKSS